MKYSSITFLKFFFKTKYIFKRWLVVAIIRCPLLFSRISYAHRTLKLFVVFLRKAKTTTKEHFLLYQTQFFFGINRT